MARVARRGAPLDEPAGRPGSLRMSRAGPPPVSWQAWCVQWAFWSKTRRMSVPWRVMEAWGKDPHRENPARTAPLPGAANSAAPPGPVVEGMMAMHELPMLPLAERCTAPRPCPRPVRLAVLRRMRMFAELTTAEIIGIEPLLRARGFRAGESIYRQGQCASGLFVLASGTAKLVRATVHGRDVVTDVLAPDEGFGTLDVLGQPVHTESAEAVTASCALEIPAEVLENAMSRHPGLARAVLAEVLRRLEKAQQTIRRLAADPVEQRVAAALLALADKLGTAERGTLTLEVPLTRADFAALTGTTPETVSRVMSRLRDEGILATGRRWTIVRDRARLAAIADG